MSADPPTSTPQVADKEASLIPRTTRFFVLAGLLSVPMTALADAQVQVQLKHSDGTAAEGVVVLKKGKQRFSCEAKAGACSIAAVPQGIYVVTVERKGKPSPKPREALIPPSGTVKLVVNAE